MRRFSRGGREVRRQRREKAPGRHPLDLFGRERQAERGEQRAGIARRGPRRVVSGGDRLDGVDLMAHLPQVPDQRGDDECLADIGSGRGDENSGHGSNAFCAA